MTQYSITTTRELTERERERDEITRRGEEEDEYQCMVGEERGGELELERANSEEEEVADSYDISRNPKARTETAKLLGCERAVLVCA